MSTDRERLARAMHAIEGLQERLEQQQRDQHMPIAVVGMGCRFPGGEDLHAFWQLLEQGRDAISKVPSDRWDADDFYDVDPETVGHCVTREGGFIGSPKPFDASFFGISPKEAATLDPQQRLLLEVSWEAMEQAAVLPENWKGESVGVFVGISGHDYSQRLLKRPMESIDPYLATGNSHSVAAGRLAYTYGFTGPTMSVDTACSSSLVALHLAVQSLRLGECNAALVGGVNRLLSPEFSINFSAAKMLAPDGRCKAFSAQADGFARAEGCGVVVLKRLEDAKRDHDSVYAIVRGSAVNQDGRSSGLTVPNGPAQQKVIRAALRDANVNPEDIDYLEAHGTGTALGDPIEAGALTAVFGASPRNAPLAVGSVKTNIGHMEAAAGIGGFIKVILSMQHGYIPAHLHFNQPSPHIPWDKVPFEVVTKTRSWSLVQNTEKSYFAGVSSFGFSGTNAHVIVEAANEALSPKREPERKRDRNPENQHSLLMLSAKDPDALAALGKRYCEYLNDSGDWYDVCYSAYKTRSLFSHRLAITAENAVQAIEQLKQFDPSKLKQSSTQSPRIAFLYTGQGAQIINMGRQLYEQLPAFKNAIDACQDIQERIDGPNLITLLYATSGESDKELDQTVNAQPALFAVAYALNECWGAWGIKPVAVLGHSIGEFAAAVAAGVLSLEDALHLVNARGRLMQAVTSSGGMMAIASSENAVRELLVGELEIAALNGPISTVVAGPVADLDGMYATCKDAGIVAQRLKVSHAFHTRAMQSVEKEFSALAQEINFKKPTLKFYSTLYGDLVSDEITHADYWGKQITNPVKFAAAVDALVSNNEIDAVIEIGPQAVLLPMFKSTAINFDGLMLASMQRGADDAFSFFNALGKLYEFGSTLRWGNHEGRIIDLPTYAFNRREHWVNDEILTNLPGLDTSLGILGKALSLAHDERIVFPFVMDPANDPLWQQHRVFDHAVLPAVASIVMALEATGSRQGNTLSSLHFTQPMLLDDNTEHAQLALKPGNDGYSFEINSRRNDEWVTHSLGQIAESSDSGPQIDLDVLRSNCTKLVSPSECYQRLAQQGVTYSHDWQLIDEIKVSEKQVWAKIALPTKQVAQGRQHVLLLDACVQTIAALFVNQSESQTYLPSAVGKVHLFSELPSEGFCFSHIQLQEKGDLIEADVNIFDEQGKCLLLLQALRLRPLSQGLQSESVFFEKYTPSQYLYELSWQKTTRPISANLPVANDVVSNLQPVFDTALQSDEQQAYALALAALDDFAIRSARRIVREVSDEKVISTSQHLLWKRMNLIAERKLKNLQQELSVENLFSAYPQATTEITLLNRCIEGIPAVLRGEVDPLELLFPAGDTSEITKLYQDTPGAKLMNLQIRDAFNELQREHNQPLRVLEIGAGTGGTTAFLVEQGYPIDYVFTDISPVLVDKAKARFANREGMCFEVLDISSDRLPASIRAGSFDLVIAANVMHATPDLRESLQRVRGLLAPGGAFILLETTEELAWLDLIFGLTSGWWAFKDHDLRPNHALLSQDNWLTLLGQSGFTASALQNAQYNTDAQSLMLANRINTVASHQWAVLTNYENDLADELAHHLSATRQLSEDCNRIVFIASVKIKDSLGDSLQHFLNLLNSLSKLKSSPQLYLVTQGALGDANDSLNSYQALLWGIGRTIELELPALCCQRIDIDSSIDAKILYEELIQKQEGTIKLRHKQRYVACLDYVQYSSLTIPKYDEYKLALKTRSAAMSFEYQNQNLLPLDPKQVRIQVKAAGLNFIDVLDGLGMLPFERDWMGVECAGEVVAIGNQVTQFQIGDRVMALAAGSFQSSVNVPESHVCLLPKGMRMQEAATIPAAFLTAWYALHDVARLQAGEKVLIHAGAGGTGMAAIQVARFLGAEVYATASRVKWPVLKRLGIKQPMDSRQPGFGAQLLEASDQRGIDVVLNSLTGDFISEGLHALASGGRFIEIGKREILSMEELNSIRDDVNYLPVDLMSIAQQDPRTIDTLFDAIYEHFQSGALSPLPQHVFTQTQIPTAFDFMQRAAHRGKVVLDFANQGAAVDEHASYVITGGLGGLGIATAEYLVSAGAKHIVLMSRTSPSQLPDVIDRMLANGVEVLISTGDVAIKKDLNSALKAATDMAPLRGIFHAAGVLVDGLLNTLDYSQMDEVLRPKVEGATLLDQLTREHRLDFFVLYSSAASLLGSPGQAAHVAANSYMDALAHQRNAMGLPALSINWGPWSKIGAAADESVSQTLASRGIHAITPEQGIAALDYLLTRADQTQTGVININWSQLGKYELASDPLFENIFAEQSRNQGDDAKQNNQFNTKSWRVELEALPVRRRQAELIKRLQQELAIVLGMPAKELPSAKMGFFDLGLDSLMGVELKNRLENSIGVELTPTVMFQHPNIESLADHLLHEYFQQEGNQNVSTDTTSTEPAHLDVDAQEHEVNGQTDDIESAINNELAELNKLMKQG